MPLQKQQGNMYDWVTHTWNCVLGECPNQCRYCYVKRSFFTKDNPAYKGPQRFNPKDENINLGTGRKIFVCHTNDLFTAGVDIIKKVLMKCLQYPNQYIFQTKNPMEALNYAFFFPPGSYLGTTIETDIFTMVSKAPLTCSRHLGIKRIKKDYNFGIKTFITIEPVMEFTESFADVIIDADPDFVNIGADSKKSGLPEPKAGSIERLISRIQDAGIEIRRKSNLERITQN